METPFYIEIQYFHNMQGINKVKSMLIMSVYKSTVRIILYSVE